MKNNKTGVRITNLNPASDIGASAWLVEMDGHRLLMDAGMHPKREGRKGLPMYKLIQGKRLDAIAITHCHHDHVGSLPVALQHFPEARVFMSELSFFLVERVLHNSVNVMNRKRDEAGITDYPLFTHNQVDDMACLFDGYQHNREIEWNGSPHKHQKNSLSPTLEFHDAGHALGSAGIMLRGKERTVFYTGDVCFRDQTVLKGARFEDIQADVLVLETTRGNHKTPRGLSRVNEMKRLTEAIHATLKRKGCILIPTFALGRTQEILAFLALLMKEGQIKPQPIYIGGLGRVFTEIYDLEAHRTHRQHSNLRLTEELNLIVPDPGSLEKMKLRGGRIFVMTAGMLNENTAAHDLAVRMAGDPKHSIFFVGYADPETPGGRLKASVKGKPFHYSDSVGKLVRQCELGKFDLTAHANREELLEFVGAVSPEIVVLAHGEDASRHWFEQQIRKKYPKIKVRQPGPGETIEY